MHSWCKRLTTLSKAGKIQVRLSIASTSIAHVWQFIKTIDSGGFDDVNAGFAKMRDGKVSAAKLVYRVGKA